MTSCDGGNRNNDRDNNNSSVTLMLQRRIDQLSFHSFQQLVFLWLSYNRWHHIRPLGRHHRQGRRSVGGADYVADLPGHSSARVAVQLRHWHSPVSRRAVDELWGFMLRHGIPTGLVVTNSVFSERAQQAVAEYPGRPIQLVSRDRLSEWLRDSGLGVRRSWRGGLAALGAKSTLNTAECMCRSATYVKAAIRARHDSADARVFPVSWSRSPSFWFCCGSSG
jgi:hypothetical protein